VRPQPKRYYGITQGVRLIIQDLPTGFPKKNERAQIAPNIPKEISQAAQATATPTAALPGRKVS